MYHSSTEFLRLMENKLKSFFIFKKLILLVIHKWFYYHVFNVYNAFQSYSPLLLFPPLLFIPFFFPTSSPFSFICLNDPLSFSRVALNIGEGKGLFTGPWPPLKCFYLLVFKLCFWSQFFSKTDYPTANSEQKKNY